MSDRQLEYCDKIPSISKVETVDIAMLVNEGVAKPVHICTNCSRRYSRVYEIYLTPALGPALVKQKVTVRFWYDEIAGLGYIKMGWKDFDAFYAALFPHYRRNGHSEGKELVWGHDRPWKVKAKKKPAPVRAIW